MEQKIYIEVIQDELIKSLCTRAEWLSKKAHILGVAVFQGRDYTHSMSSF